MYLLFYNGPYLFMGPYFLYLLSQLHQAGESYKSFIFKKTSQVTHTCSLPVTWHQKSSIWKSLTNVLVRYEVHPIVCAYKECNPKYGQLAESG
jgi:hypothetical protein